MKVLYIVLGLAIITLVSSKWVLGNNDILCEIERIYLISQHDACIPDGYSLENIFDKFQNTANEQFSRYEMQQYVQEFCAKTDNATACYNVMSVTERCENSEGVINEINTFKFVETALKFMCEDGGSRFVSILNDDGPECYAMNNEHTECVESQMENLNLDVEQMANVFIGQNICRFIRAAKYCLYTYDNCVNKDVKYHMTELNKVLNNEYRC